MTSLGYLIKRNIKLFFKDKGMFFSSLITPLILLLLYATFLAKVYRDSFVASLPDGFVLTDSVINPGDGASSAGFTGWITSKLGTIVTVVCIIGVCLLAVFFIFKAVQSQVDIPTLDDLGDALNNVSTNGGAE